MRATMIITGNKFYNRFFVINKKQKEQCVEKEHSVEFG